MASSQVEIATSNPFACIMRTQMNTSSKNLKGLVRDRIHTRISFSPESTPSGETAVMSTSTSHSEPSSPSKAPVSAPNRVASSLVQIWEARLGRSASMVHRNNPVVTEITYPTVSRSSSNNSSSSSCNFNDELSRQLEALGRSKSNDSSTCSELTLNPSLKSKVVDNESDLEQKSRPNQKSKIVVRELDSISTGSTSCQKRKMVDKESDPSGLKLTSGASHRPKKVIKESDPTASTVSSPVSEVTSRASHRENTDREEFDPTVSDDSSFCSERASRPRQRPKIADLIRRLMAANSSNSKKTTNSDSKDVGPDRAEQTESHPRIDGVEGSDRKIVTKNNHCPRLRGRHAFNDLLLMMEHDRYSELEVIGERKTVSGFSHKGRIQSLLRLKILQRGLSLQDRWCPHLRSTKPNHDAHGSTVHLSNLKTESSRGKSTNANDQIVYPKDGDIGSSSHPHSSESATPQLNSESTCTVISIPIEDVPEPLESSIGWYREWPLEEEEERDEDAEVNHGVVEDAASERFLGVARPRSYWDDRRKAWYRQVLAVGSDDSEIRELLERKTVSTVLKTESDFHRRMNLLMRSHVQRQIDGITNEEDDQIPRNGFETMRRFLSSYLQQQCESLQSSSHESREPEPEEEEDDQDLYLRRQERMEELCLQVCADSRSSHEDATDEAESINVHQNTTWSISTQSSPMRNNGDGGRVPAMSESLQGGSVDRVSMEMELIHELRGQMKQLYQEMSELRRCVSNCIDVQVKFQDSMKKEMMTAVRGGFSKSEERAPRKGYCCICYEMKVNSLLYRCGHMCTCLECADELQRGSGKCPICRSTILDVVKAYTEM